MEQFQTVLTYTHGEEGKNRAEEIFFKIMAENFTKLVTDMKSQIQEAHRTPSRINIKHTHTHT